MTRLAERKLQQLEFNGDRSVCASIVTRLYGLSPLEYKKMRTSFESELGQSLPGIYVAKYDDQEPEFVLVVELPTKPSALGIPASVGIGTAAGLATGLAIWHANREKVRELEKQIIEERKKVPLLEDELRNERKPKEFIKKVFTNPLGAWTDLGRWAYSM